MATGVMLTMLVMRYVSHATELFADRFAVTTAHRLKSNPLPPDLAMWIPDSRQEVACVLAQTLVTLCASNPQASKATSMHPSLTMRVARFRAVAQAAQNSLTCTDEASNCPTLDSLTLLDA